MLKKRQIKLLITLLVTALAAFGVLTTPAKQELTQFSASQNPGLYKVDHVADGDTIVVKSGDKKEKVRLIGVDTPEKNDPRKPIQCFAAAASDFTTRELKDKEVRLEADSQGDSRDRYGRLLRHVYLPDGTLLNKKIITEGYGFAMVGFPHSKMEEFKAAEREAKAQSRGLWSSCDVSATDKGYPQTNTAN